MPSVFINCLHYQLGESRVWHRDLVRFSERIQELGVPDDPTFWNWGYFRRTDLLPDQWLLSGLSRFIDLTNQQDRREVDAAILCSPTLSDVSTCWPKMVGEFANRLTGTDVAFFSLNSGDCSNVMLAIHLARSLILSGEARSVLVVGFEKVSNDLSRIVEFAFYSDFVISFLVTNNPDSAPYSLEDSVSCCCFLDAASSATDFGEVEGRCVEKLLSKSGVSKSSVTQLFSLNIFEPLSKLRGRLMGFEETQVYTNATADFSHCFGADPLISMLTFHESRSTAGPYVLAGAGTGQCSAALVHRCAPA